jgi:dCTP deaminase
VFFPPAPAGKMAGRTRGGLHTPAVAGEATLLLPRDSGGDTPQGPEGDSLPTIPPVILSDRSIRAAIEQGRIQVEPFDPGLIQPSSLDLRVDRHFRVFAGHRYPFIDPREPQADLTTEVEADEDHPFVLHPGEFVLGSTLERLCLGNDVVARLEGKSSLGRLGLLIHSTAGFVDPGFEGHLTLELSNVARLPIAIFPGMPIGQLSFYELSTAAEFPYGSPQVHSKYQGQSGPTPSRLHEDFPRQAGQ